MSSSRNSIVVGKAMIFALVLPLTISIAAVVDMLLAVVYMKFTHPWKGLLAKDEKKKNQMMLKFFKVLNHKKTLKSLMVLNLEKSRKSLKVRTQL